MYDYPYGMNNNMQQQLAQGKSEDELKQVAVNLCQQRGININEAYKQFQNFMGGMNR